MQIHSWGGKTSISYMEKRALWRWERKMAPRTFIKTQKRNIIKWKKVKAVTYDAHDQAVIKSFQLICNNAKNKFDKSAKIFLEHAKGYAPVGEVSILIAVGSGHRNEAFKICRYILEEVKHQSPIWKKEHYADGKEEWLPGHSLRPKKEI